MATKPTPKKKGISKSQATAVANYMKNGNGGPALPTPKTSPITTDDDDVQSQGA